jgi:transcriptional regulator with XRE-family HTH domain
MTKEILRTLMGENIRRERVARQMSIDELAEVLEVTPGFIGLMERGQRGATAYTMHKLSQAFDMPMDVMFAQSDGTSLSMRENDDDEFKVMRKKINALTSGLTVRELNFVIKMINNIMKMNRADADDSEEEE